MKFKWEVEDGYAGKSRPQYTNIPDSELEEYEEGQEREDFINQCIQEDFEQKITWFRY